jgi:hypothetical protein
LGSWVRKWCSSGAGGRAGSAKAAGFGVPSSGSKMVLMAPKHDFRFALNSGHRQTGPVGPVRAKNRLYRMA